MFSAPNYTQTPNDFFDELIPTLKEGELRVLLIIMRQTLGWRKSIDQLSFTFLCKKTGMCRDAVNNSLKSLVEKKLIMKIKEGEIGTEKCYYGLVVQDDSPQSSKDTGDQSSEATPPSRQERPTKETNTKEISKERKPPFNSPQGEKSAPPPQKEIFEFKKIKMAGEEYEKLKRDNPSVPVDQMIEQASDWLDAEGKSKKDYAAFMRNWIKNSKTRFPSQKQERKFLPCSADNYHESENWQGLKKRAIE